MKVGILSDSHDHRDAAAGALLLFRAERVGMVLHLGDVCSPVVLAGYADRSIPFLGVFGNCDADRDGLQQATGGAFRQGPHIEAVDGRKILLAHSYDQLQGELSGQGRFDLVLFGHTHRPLTMRVGKALVLNPGEACGLVRGKNTCAIVDLATMEPRIVEIPLPEAG
ncbi:metallophosphoesterase [Candidatus Deferrimicrobium sp.]|uniref:metallophosphoesterase n=1 Tax=Candidatus Deferrimicrobium sp. TaxID=3060586 RepID=UPI002ED7967D